MPLAPKNVEAAEVNQQLDLEKMTDEQRKKLR